MITITEKFGLTVQVHSSYGNWSYTWSQPGENPIKFLETANPDYTFQKFSNSIRLGASGRIQKREYVSYLDFYNKFWNLMIEELKKI